MKQKTTAALTSDPSLLKRLISGVALLVFIDQGTKFWARQQIDVLVISSWLQLTCVYNHGMLWGLGQGYGVYASTLGCMFLMYALWRSALLRTHRYSTLLLIAGCLGNSLDRLLHGAVVDWIDLHWKLYHWPAFNCADIYLVFSALGLCIKNDPTQE